MIKVLKIAFDIYCNSYTIALLINFIKRVLCKINIALATPRIIWDFSVGNRTILYAKF